MELVQLAATLNEEISVLFSCLFYSNKIIFRTSEGQVENRDQTQNTEHVFNFIL